MAGVLRRLYWARYRARKRGEEPPRLPERPAPIETDHERVLRRLYCKRHKAKLLGIDLPSLPEKPTPQGTERDRALKRYRMRRLRAERSGLPCPPLPDDIPPLPPKEANGQPKRKISTREQRQRWGKAFLEKHPDYDRLKQQRRRQNPEVRAHEVAYSLQWKKDHPEENAAAYHRRRAREKNAPVNDLTAAQWQEIKAVYGYRCVYCGKKTVALTQDHITPLAKGGAHTASNIVPACQPCNSKKHTGPPLIPVQPLLLTIAEPRKLRKKAS